MTAAEVARRAADLLERDGWCQGRFSTFARRRCLSGALMAADRWGSPAVQQVQKQVLVHTGTWCPSQWNDAPGRTADEVIALLRQVADELEAS